jgi:hypothetical protein
MKPDRWRPAREQAARKARKALPETAGIAV